MKYKIGYEKKSSQNHHRISEIFKIIKETQYFFNGRNKGVLSKKIYFKDPFQSTNFLFIKSKSLLEIEKSITQIMSHWFHMKDPEKLINKQYLIAICYVIRNRM